ncbi:MAG: hypothetical protein C0603_10980 [Denitrovibrio sp.]|nr:MAG: hypothetical protein C0603_10980 [Denitrovibrio sp.]
MNEKILVVDDDQELRDNIVEILESSGFETRTAVSAEDAQEVLTEYTPSLIVMDNMMPGIGGIALIPYMKKTYPTIRIIIITAFATVDNAVEAMKIGADDYLSKPFKKDELLMAVRKNLEEGKFSKCVLDIGMDDTLSCLSSNTRREIMLLLSDNRDMRFMDITRSLGIEDHTKVNFHLKNLVSNKLVVKNKTKTYSLSDNGEKVIDCLVVMTAKLKS